MEKHNPMGAAAWLVVSVVSFGASLVIIFLILVFLERVF